MIIVYEGIPGSGKTYDAVRKLTDNLRLGRKCYTNIDGMASQECAEAMKFVSGLNDYDFARLFHFLSADDIKHFWEICEPGSLIVLDEIHKYFNSRDWQTENNRGFGSWASTHRHGGYDLVLITQKIEKIDSQVRTLAEWTYRYRKINFVGNLIQKGYIVYCHSGDDTSDVLSKQIRRYDKKVFACYQSYATKDTKEMGVQKTANVLKHPVFFAIPIVIGIAIYFISQSSLITGDLFGVSKVQARVDKQLKDGQIINAPKSAASAAVAPAPAVAAAPAPAKVSSPPVPPPMFAAVPVPAVPEKKLVAVVNGVEIFKCGAKLCLPEKK